MDCGSLLLKKENVERSVKMINGFEKILFPDMHECFIKSDITCFIFPKRTEENLSICF